MTLPEIKTLETALKIRADELARAVAERNLITVERSADVFDATLLAAERETSARVLERNSRLLHEVEAARERMRRGSFGVYLRCEEHISPKRLRALPWTAHCVSCQEEVEQVGKLLPRMLWAA
jgi:DnaK suppressor protein